MDELLFDQSAEDQLAGLQDDLSRHQLYDRVNDVLDMIEDDPGNREVRRRRFQEPPHWLVPIHGSGEDWMVMWELTEAGPLIHYIGKLLS